MFDLSHARTAAPAAPLAAAHRPLRSLPIRLWHSVARGRSALGRLDAHLLADIGLTPEMAQSESARPFWDVPAHWRG